jgi:hypothetical protein
MYSTAAVESAADVDIADGHVGIPNQESGTERSGGVAFNAKAGKMRIADLERDDCGIGLGCAAWQPQRVAPRGTRLVSRTPVFSRICSRYSPGQRRFPCPRQRRDSRRKR